MIVGATSSALADVSNGDVFERISAVGDLADGDEIIFVNQAETYACGTTQNTNNRTPVSIDVTDHKYTYESSDNVQVFVVKINGSGNFGFHTGSGYIYSASTGSNYLKTNNSAITTAPGTTSAWDLTVSSYVFTVKNQTNTSYYLAFNGTSFFSQYKSGQSKPYIFKKQVAPAATLESIALSGTYPTTFHQGDAFSHEGMTVTATYDDDSEEDVTANATFSGYNMNETGDQTVTVSYTENEVTKTAEYGITVSAPATLSTISLSGDYQTVFTEGDEFNHEGLVVTANYDDDTHIVVTSDAVFSTPDMNEVGTQTITVTYGGKTTTYDITVNPLPKYTVTFSDGGSETQASYGAAVTLPSRSETAGYAFAGWSTTNVAEETTDAPIIIPAGSYTPTTNITLYPVYTKTEGGGGLQNETASVTISAYATANNWSNGTAYQPLNMDANISVGGEVSGNNFKYYTSDSSWRFYTGGSFTITANNGATLSSVTLTISSGTLKYGETTLKSGTAFDVTGNSAIISCTANAKITAISVDYTIAGAGTTYYWSAPVAAAVEKPTITVAENPFLFSTTATITCETDDATIYYSYDNTNWTEYTTALTITEAKTIYAKAVMDANESTVASVTATKNLATPTVTISGDLIVDLNGETDVEAGKLTAAVTYYEAAVDGAVVTWSSSNADVATIDAETGDVTIKTRGTVTFTATYAGNGDYAEATDTKQITVTDSKAPGSAGNPYTVAQAKAAIDASEGTTDVYVAGIVSQVDSYNSTYKSITYWISDDGTTTNQFEVYSGKGIGGADFSSVADIQVGDVVVVNGDIKLYNTTYEFDKNNQLVSLVRKVATPTFDPAAGEVIAGSTVTISTTTEDATIYYTTNGDEPTTESTSYTGPITIDAAQTIKAIAVKDGMTNSDVASASYTIIVTPTIAISTNSIEATAAGADDIVALAYSNLTINDESDFAVQYYDNLGEEIDAPNWMEAEVLTEDDENYSVLYTIGENTSTEPRTAYFKVYAMDDETNLVYSNLVTVTQAGMVIDYVTLPFEYNGGRDGIPTGLTQSGLGTDYNSSTAPNTQLKFDGSSDELTLKINEAATILSFNIKGNGFSGGTFKVQTSVDGEYYNDLKIYTELSESQETFVLGANIRYIKWIYTKKQSGNVGLGNIKVEKRMGDATVTLASACNDGEGNYYGTYSNTTGFVVPEGLTVAEVGINAENKLIVEEYATGAIVPANTGVMVSSTTDGAHDIVLSTGGTSVLGEDNRLRASGAGITAEAMAAADSECLFYRLTMHNGTDIGFWWGAEDGAAFNLAANKAYLAVPSAVSVKGFSLFSDDETGITEVAEKTEGTEKVFDLSGRRVVKPTKGLYIVNGKKYIKK